MTYQNLDTFISLLFWDSTGYSESELYACQKLDSSKTAFLVITKYLLICDLQSSALLISLLETGSFC